MMFYNILCGCCKSAMPARLITQEVDHIGQHQTEGTSTLQSEQLLFVLHGPDQATMNQANNIMGNASAQAANRLCLQQVGNRRLFN
jgi:hypothetical protein